jgi:hypothetical protein
MTTSRKINYSALLKFLHEEIDRRYRNKNTGAWRSQQVIDYNADPRAGNDDWFNLNRLLAMKEGQSALKSFCKLGRPSSNAGEIENFLMFELDSVDGDLLFLMTRPSCSRILGNLISLHQASKGLNVERNKGGRPKNPVKQELARLLDKVSKERRCVPSDSGNWPTFCNRAEERFLTIPGHKGLNKHKWTDLKDADNSFETVLRYHREYHKVT